jgi:hypothetical protein
MRRVLTASLIGVVVLLFPTAASADPRDMASGAGTFMSFDQGPVKVNFTGHGTPTDASGQVHIDWPGLAGFADLKGKVDCLNVNGRDAALSGELDEPAHTPFGDFPYFHLSVRDNSESGDDPPDQVGLVLSPVPFSCLIAEGAPIPFERGNVVVRDNTP